MFQQRYGQPCWFVEKTQIVSPTPIFKRRSERISTSVAFAFAACTFAIASSWDSTFVIAVAIVTAVDFLLSQKSSPTIDLVYFLPFRCCCQSCFVVAAFRAFAVITLN